MAGPTQRQPLRFHRQIVRGFNDEIRLRYINEAGSPEPISGHTITAKMHDAKHKAATVLGTYTVSAINATDFKVVLDTALLAAHRARFILVYINGASTLGVDKLIASGTAEIS